MDKVYARSSDAKLANSIDNSQPSTQRTKRKLEDLSSGDEPTERAKSTTAKKRQPTKTKHVTMDLDSGDSVVDGRDYSQEGG